MPAGPASPTANHTSGRRLATALVLGVGIAVAQAASAAHAAPSTPAPAARTAPVLGAARNGGSVIVWLEHQHNNLSLSKQGAARTAAAHADQKPIVASIKASGGTHILRLVAVNAVAAHVSAAEVKALRTNPAVLRIIPDTTVTVGDRESRGPQYVHAVTVPDKDAVKHANKRANKTNAPADGPGVNPFPTVNNCGTLDNPLVEPEALGDIHAPAMTDAGLATEPGHGVIVANDGISVPQNGGDLVGNPNFVRPAADGGGSVVVDAQPGDTTDSSDGEYYGDASSIAAQGTVEYQYSKELPYSNMPDSCYFKIVGDAPGASLIDTDNINTPESAAGQKNPATLRESQIVAGIDAAVTKEHADVINESYGYSNTPGSYILHYAANDAAVDAGVTVVASSGDSGEQGTVSSPASDPKIIAAGATNTLRLNAMAYGFTGWVNDDITPLSSGGTTPDNKVVDLVAPGYGGEAACNPDGTDCPENTQTEAFGGTSESSPLIAGAAADVIQAYRDSHNGESPSPALVKEILTSTASDVDAPADEQGAGLLNIQAAMDAAVQMPNNDIAGTGSHLIVNPTQLDLKGNGGDTSYQTVNVYNAGNASTTVTGNFRTLGPEQQLGDVVTENVSAPDESVSVPVDGAQAAPDITFNVPSGLDRINADMIWPDPTNGNILSFTLTDPEGRLRQISYDYGTAGTQGRTGTVPDIQHVEVAHPEAGTWKAEIKWANGRSHLQEPPNIPGTYTGTVSFRVTSQNYVTEPATSPVTIAAHKSANIPVAVTFPNDPGDHPQSIQFTADDGAATSVPVQRRTLVPSSGGEFDTQIEASVGRGIGQISTFNVNVPAGRPDLGVTVATPDTSADDGMTLYLVNPNGTSVATHVSNGRTVGGVPLTTQTINGSQMAVATFHVANPAEGTWEIDVKLNLTTSGQEFRQTVVGDVLPQAPTISAPGNNATLDTQTPTVSGTGAPGDTVTVVDGNGDPVCTAVVQQDGTWSCSASTLSGGAVTLTATQADQTGFPSLPASVSVSVPNTATVSLGIQPDAPAAGEAVTLTATTTNVPDGTTVTFTDDGNSLGTAQVSSNSASLDLSGGLDVGDHPLQASVPATDTSLAAQSSELDVMISKTASTISLSLDNATVPYGTAATGSVSVSGATDGTATVTIRSSQVSVPIGADGTGTFTLPAAQPVGRHRVYAQYDGTDTVAASNVATTPLTVVKAPTTTTVHPAKSSVVSGSTLHVKVNVSGHQDALYPAGHVTARITVGSHTQSVSAVLAQSANGTVTISVPVPAHAGTGQVTATFPGNKRFTGSDASPVSITVTPH